MQNTIERANATAIGGGLLVPNQAASMLHVNERTLANWRVAGRGPRFVKIGSRVCYRASDLQAFIDDNTYSNTAAASAGVVSGEVA